MWAGLRGMRIDGKLPAGRIDQKSKALCVNAERLEGSPPPELPDYECHSVSNASTCKYTFRNHKVTHSNHCAMM